MGLGMGLSVAAPIASCYRSLPPGSAVAAFDLGSGVTVRITVATDHGLLVGDSFQINGSSNANYNGKVYQVTQVDSSTIFWFNGGVGPSNDGSIVKFS